MDQFSASASQPDALDADMPGHQAVHRVLQQYFCPIHAEPHDCLLRATVMHPLVSIIVSTMGDRPTFLVEAIRSILAQTYNGIEIIVINDGGEDTTDLLRSFETHGSLTHLRHHRNHGVPVARNTALSYVRSTYIGYLDDDDLFYPHHVATLVQALESGSHHAVFSMAYRATQELQDDGTYMTVRRDVTHSKPWNLAESFVGNFTPLPCVMHTRTCLESVGGFHPLLSSHEDWELWLRIGLQFPFHFIQDITCEYTWRTNGSSMTSSKQLDMLRTMTMVHEMYAPLVRTIPEIQQAQMAQRAWMRRHIGLSPDPVSEPTRTTPIELSIIILTHNNLAYTQQCVASILETIGSISHELIIVDNASTDGTQTWLSTFAQEHTHHRVRVLYNQTNASFSHANNQGARIATGNYLLFLNNDVKVLPGSISAILREFVLQPHIAIQGAKLLYENGTIQHAGMVYGTRGSTECEPYHAYLCAPADAPFVNRMRMVQFVTGACLAIRHTVFQTIGGFDETYFFGWEDTDLCLRAQRYGWNVLYNPHCTMYHFESVTKRSVDTAMTHATAPHEQRNRAYFMQTWKEFLREDAPLFYADDGIMIQGTSLVPLTDEGKRLLAGYRMTSHAPLFWQRDYAHCTRVTILLGGAIGDALCITSVVHALHTQYPHLHIFIISTETVCGLFLGHPALAGCAIAGTPEAQQILRTTERLINYQHILAQLPEYYQGMGFRDILGNIAGIRHDEYRIVFTPTESERTTVRTAIKQLYTSQTAPEESLLIAVQFTTEKDPKRSYPHGNAVVEQLLELYPNAYIMVFGTAPLHAQHDRIFHAGRHGLTLREQIVCVQECHAVISIDSALFHLGHALTSAHHRITPTLVIAGLTNPVLIGNPQQGFYAVQNPMLSCLHCYWQRPCGIECMHQLSPDMIVQSFRAMLHHARHHHVENLFPPSLHHSHTLLAEQAHTEIHLTEQDDYRRVLALHYAQRSGTRVTLYDDHDILPAPSIKWNGIEVVRRKKQQEQTGISHTDDYRHTMIRTQTSTHDSTSSDVARSAPQAAVGVLPQPLPTPLYLNLGCGTDIRDGFLNLDMYSDDPRVVGIDVRRIPIESNYADGIIASDILQQIPLQEISATLREWARVLKPHGECVLRVPSFKGQAQTYLRGEWSAEQASQTIFGEQKNPHDVNRIVFDETFLRKHLVQAGFDVSRIEEQLDDSTNNVSLVIYATKSAFQDFLTTQQQRRTIQPIGFAQSTTAQAPIRASAPEVQSPSDRLTAIPPHTKEVQASNDTQGANKQQSISDVPTTQPPQSVDGKQINIVWEGAQFMYSSFATINREHAYNLAQCRGVELTTIPFGNDEFSPQGNSRMESLFHHDIRQKPTLNPATKKLPYIWVRHTWPPKTDKPPGAKWILMQPWEMSTVRRDVFTAAMGAEEVWTPSVFSREAFLRSGVPAHKVQVIPNGVRTDIFTPFGNHAELPSKKRFIFLYVGGATFRKGADLLLQAYAQAFTAHDDVALVIKGMGKETFYKNSHLPMDDLIATFRATPEAPEVWYMDDNVADEQIADLMRACSVFVCPSRGEGFNMPTLEAMACGKPVIVTEGMGMDDFVDEEVGWLIPSDPLHLDNPNDELVGDCVLRVPRIPDLVLAMQEAYHNVVVSATKGMDAALRARTQWTWNRATLKALDRIDVLCGTTLAKDSEAVLRDKDDGIIAFGKAEQEYFVGHIDQAIDLYHVAITLGGLSVPYALLALHRLASFCIEEKQYALAEEYLEKCDQLVDDHPDTQYLEATIARLRADYDTALTIFSPLLEAWKHHRFVSRIGITLDLLLCETAECLYRLNEKEEARDMFALAVELNAENIQGWYGAGVCLRDLNDPDNARLMFERALEIDPAFAPAQQELAEMDTNL
jgi:GT2 family glycosyltransferase/glycosyltransferase involved in cell wall biosynthesis/predicted SAM-dependent methyltransferase/ADP-heptose:LPS heptosyltransferase